MPPLLDPPPADAAPFRVVPAGPTLRGVAWPQVAYLTLLIVGTLSPLAIAFALAV